MLIYSLPNDKILDCQIRILCRRQLKVSLNDGVCRLWSGNIVEKGKNAGYQHFLLSSLCFRGTVSQRREN